MVDSSWSSILSTLGLLLSAIKGVFNNYIKTKADSKIDSIDSIETLLQKLKNKHFTEETRVFLEEYLENEYAKKITGFWVEKNIRDEMIKWNKEFGIGIACLRKAQSYIHNENLIVDIKIKGVDCIFNVLVLIGTFIAAFLSMTMFFNSIKQVLTNPHMDSLVGISASLFLYCIATFIFVVHSQTIPFYSAWKIKKIKDRKISL